MLSKRIYDRRETPGGGKGHQRAPTLESHRSQKGRGGALSVATTPLLSLPLPPPFGPFLFVFIAVIEHLIWAKTEDNHHVPRCGALFCAAAITLLNSNLEGGGGQG
jgi:hypothetical protein